VYLKALLIKPELAIAHYNLGNIALREPGGPQRAIVHYRRALQVDPHYAPAQVNWGGLLFEQGKIDEAIDHYRIALEIKPDLLQAHALLGTALMARGEFKEAKFELLWVLDKIPADSPMAKRLRGILDEMDKQQ
jgi:tetratricopeptide (TPR) repeat protein